MKFIKVSLFVLIGIIFINFLSILNVSIKTKLEAAILPVYKITVYGGMNGNTKTYVDANPNDVKIIDLTPSPIYGTVILKDASGCGGSLSGYNFTTAPITKDCSITTTYIQGFVQVTGQATQDGGCQIATGNSSCDTNISWGTWNSTSSVLKKSNGTVIPGTAKTVQGYANYFEEPYSLPYGGKETFTLYNSGIILGSYAISNIHCNWSSAWDTVSKTCKALPTTGTLTSSDCSIAEGASSCTTAISWKVTNPKPGWWDVVKEKDKATMVTGASPQNISINYPSAMYELWHLNATSTSAESLLKTITINASCIVGTSWDTVSKTCKDFPPIGNIAAADCTIAKGASSCTTSLSWSVTNPNPGWWNVAKPENEATIVTGASPQNITISYPSKNYQIWHLNATSTSAESLLKTITIKAICIDGTIWDTTSSNCKTAISLNSISISGSTDLRINKILTPSISPSGTTATYQWSRGDTATGTFTDFYVPGSTSHAYGLVETDLGKYIKVTATGTGSYSGSVSSIVGPITMSAVLTVKKSGTGTGTITAPLGTLETNPNGPDGINCGTNCVEGYPAGKSVSLNASPDTGSAFAGWSGDADCSNGVIVISNTGASTSCVATFNISAAGITMSDFTATTPYTRQPNYGMSFAYTTPTVSSGTVQCKLLDNSGNDKTIYSVANPIIYGGTPSVDGVYAYYIKCQSMSDTTVTKTSNQIILNVVTPAAACSDGIKNQDETGIDTGGICASGILSVSPSSCTINAGFSTCTVTGATWQTTKATSPVLIDNNTGAPLSNLANKAVPLQVWVAYPQTVFKLMDGTKQLGGDAIVTSSCISGTTWDILSNTCKISSGPSPVDGGWSAWSGTICGQTGFETRYCSNPAPSNGGVDCLKLDGTRDTSESRFYASVPCSASCPIVDQAFCLSNCSGYFPSGNGNGNGNNNGNSNVFTVCPDGQKNVGKNGKDWCISKNPVLTIQEC